MFISKSTKQAFILFSAVLLGGTFCINSLAVSAQACEAHNGQYRQIVSEVDVLVDVHTLAEHHQEMVKHSEVLGFTGSHIAVVQLLDRATGQAITKANVTADVVGPDQKVIAKGAALKWFAPQGRAPYYGLGMELAAKGTYTITVNFMEFQTPRKATFSYSVR